MEWVVIRSTHQQQRLSVHFPVVNSFICAFILWYCICLFLTLSTALEKSLSASNCHIKVTLYFICVFSVLSSIFRLSSVEQVGRLEERLPWREMLLPLTTSHSGWGRWGTGPPGDSLFDLTGKQGSPLSLVQTLNASLVLFISVHVLHSSICDMRLPLLSPLSSSSSHPSQSLPHITTP